MDSGVLGLLAHVSAADDSSAIGFAVIQGGASEELKRAGPGGFDTSGFLTQPTADPKLGGQNADGETREVLIEFQKDHFLRRIMDEWPQRLLLPR